MLGLQALADVMPGELSEGLVLGICDRVVVLEFGRVIADGPPQEVRNNAAVITAYLGKGAEAMEVR